MNRENRDSVVEVRVGKEHFTVEKYDWSDMRFLGHDEFVELLRDRLKRSEAEILELLESYHPSVSTN